VNTLLFLSYFLLFILFLIFLLKKKKIFCLVYAWLEILNLELIPIDPDIDKTLRRTRRALVESEIRGEMGDQRENIPKNVEQPRFENEDAKAENVEQVRAWHMDFT
jgi:hypothetical protein